MTFPVWLYNTYFNYGGKEAFFIRFIPDLMGVCCHIGLFLSPSRSCITVFLNVMNTLLI